MFQSIDGGRFLEGRSGIHDCDPVAEPSEHTKIVTDTDKGDLRRMPEIGQQIKDAKLSGHVEPGGRLVQKQQLRLSGKGHGDRSTLHLASRELVWESARQTLRIRQPHLGEQLDRALLALLAAELGMQRKGLIDLGADPERGCEGGPGVLRDQRQPAATNELQPLLGCSKHRHAIEQDVAANVGKARFDDPHQRQQQRALTRAGLTRNSEAATARQREARLLDDWQHTFLGLADPDGQGLDRE